VTPRRFLALANPGLRELLDRIVGFGWLTDLRRLRGLEPFVDDASFRQQWRDVQRSNKGRLAEAIRSSTGVDLSRTDVRRAGEAHPRIQASTSQRAAHHRALLAPQAEPRAFDSAARVHLRPKSAPGYFMAKRIIKLINAVGETVNADPHVSKFLKVAFVPNFSVKNAHRIYPAADPLRADLHSGEGSVGHRQHEIATTSRKCGR
jgi:starch phosphorylase